MEVVNFIILIPNPLGRKSPFRIEPRPAQGNVRPPMRISPALASLAGQFVAAHALAAALPRQGN